VRLSNSSRRKSRLLPAVRHLDGVSELRLLIHSGSTAIGHHLPTCGIEARVMLMLSCSL
jgi:hypothetical protein